jgi:TctA family transporter
MFKRHAMLAWGYLHGVMAGLVPAIHVLTLCTKNVDARDKPGHDEHLCV